MSILMSLIQVFILLNRMHFKGLSHGIKNNKFDVGHFNILQQDRG